MSLGTIAMISVKVKLLQAITTPFSRHLPKNSIFGHFSTIVPAHGRPIDPTSAFIDENVITGCCCIDIYRERAISGYYHPIFSPFAHLRYIDKTRCCCNDTCGEKATPGYYHPILPPFAWKFNFWPFLTIFHKLCLLISNPLIPPLLLLTKVLSPGVVAMISTK